MSGHGWSPLGYDKGPLPPGSYQQQPGGYWSYPQYQQCYGWAVPIPPQVQIPVQPNYPAYTQPAYYAQYAAYQQPYQQPVSFIAPQPYNTTTPQPHRRHTCSHSKPKDGGMPGTNLQNPYGGTGNVPGFNYMFSPKVSPIIFIRSGAVRPWSSDFAAHASNPSVAPVKMTPFMVPSSMTVQDLLKGCGAKNAAKEKNVVTEVVSQGNGRWARGLCIHAGEKRAEKKIEEFGWDDSRKGLLGGKPYTYLYVTCDTKKGDL